MPLGAIRELIPRLEADGLIRTVPQRGMQVAQVDLELIRNAFQFRILIEREAAARFATERARRRARAPPRTSTRPCSPRRRRASRRRWWRRRRRSTTGCTRPSSTRWATRIISNAYRVNSIKIRLIRQSETRLYADLVVPVMRVHLDVIAAIASRDPQRAAAAMEAHIVGVARPRAGLRRRRARRGRPRSTPITAGAPALRRHDPRATTTRATGGGKR